MQGRGRAVLASFVEILKLMENVLELGEVEVCMIINMCDLGWHAAKAGQVIAFSLVHVGELWRRGG